MAQSTSLSKTLAYTRTAAAQAFFTHQPLHAPTVHKSLIEKTQRMLPNSPGFITIRHFRFENTRGTVPYYQFNRESIVNKPLTVDELRDQKLKGYGMSAKEDIVAVEQELKGIVESNSDALERILKKANGAEVISLKEELSKIEQLSDEQFAALAKKL